KAGQMVMSYKNAATELVSCTRTVVLLTTVAWPKPPATAAMIELILGLPKRLSVQATSSAGTGCPFENLMPGRREKGDVLPSGETVHRSARDGTMLLVWPVGSDRTSPL